MKLRDLLNRMAATLVDQLEQRTLLWPAVMTAGYLISTGWLAAHKLMWNDELYTFYIARLPHLQNIWQALLTGGEQTPPVFHITSRVMLALVDPNNRTMTHLAIRLPEIVGFWVMCLCLFRFVAKRTSPLYGWIALLFPLATNAYFYAFEARAYAIVLGFAGVALLCWQTAAETPRRLALAGLAFSLAGAISNHYYGVLVVFALGIGEAVRSITLRRVDWPVWGALGVGLLAPLAVFYPLIKQSHTYSTIFWSPPQWSQLPMFYSSLLTPCLPPLAAALMISAVPTVRSANLHPSPQSDAAGPLSHEIAAAFGLASIPLMALILANLATHAFTDRYALPAVMGLSLLCAFGAHRIWEKRSLPVATLIVLLGLAWIDIISFYRLTVMETSAGSIISQKDLIRMQHFLQTNCKDPAIPIAVADTHTFMVLVHYGTPSLVSRLVYLADPVAEGRYLSHNSIDQGMLDLVKPWFRVPVQPYASFIKANPRFWIFSSARETYWNWVLPQSLADHRPVAVKAQDGGDMLFLVGASR